MSILAQYENAWIRAAEGDLSGIENLYDPDFSGFSHSSGREINKDDVLKTADLFKGATVEKFRIIFENEDFACIQHNISMHEVEQRRAGAYSIVVAITLKNGPIVPQETGMTKLG